MARSVEIHAKGVALRQVLALEHFSIKANQFILQTKLSVGEHGYRNLSYMHSSIDFKVSLL